MVSAVRESKTGKAVGIMLFDSPRTFRPRAKTFNLKDESKLQV